MGCGTAVVKYAVFIFNLLFLLIGIGFIVIGSLFTVYLTKYTGDLGILAGYINFIPILVIVIGCIVFIVSFFGCCGAIKENICMLSTYGVILLLIFLIQVGLGTFAFITLKNGSDDLKNEISNAVVENIQEYLKGTNGTVQTAVDNIQQGMECCGAQDYKDWDGRVPNSCCKDNQCGDPPQYFESGCVSKIFDMVNNIITTAAIVVFSIAAVELGAAIIAFCLCSCIRNNERRGAYY